MIGSAGRSTAPYFMGMFLVGHSNADGWLLTASVGLIALILLIILYFGEESYKNKKSEVMELIIEEEAS